MGSERGEPDYVSLTSWTDYQSESSFRKWTRVIDMATGDILDSVDDHSYALTVTGNRYGRGSGESAG